MDAQTQDFRYHVVDNQFKVMNSNQEYEWLYKLIEAEVKKVIGTNNPDDKQLYTFDDSSSNTTFQKLQLQTLIEVASSLGIDCEQCENAPCFFHFTDRDGNAHGFDIKDFVSRDQLILNSFGSILVKNVDCVGSNIIPFLLPSYPDSPIGDAILLINNLPGLEVVVEVIDYTHPEFTIISNTLRNHKKQN